MFLQLFTLGGAPAMSLILLCNNTPLALLDQTPAPLMWNRSWLSCFINHTDVWVFCISNQTLTCHISTQLIDYVYRPSEGFARILINFSLKKQDYIIWI